MEQERKIKYLSKSEALQCVRKYCAYQERSHSEVRNKLLQYGQKGLDLEEMIAKLIEENYLNEERFAKAFSGGKFRMKGWGKNKIIQQLQVKRVSAYNINQALKEIDNAEYEKMLKKIIQKRTVTLKGLTSFEKKNKLARYLITKGYETELVWNILNKMFD